MHAPTAHLILASASPRRRDLLGHLGLPFEVVISGFDESSLSHVRPESHARALAAAKAAEVANAHPEAIVLAADTIVVCRGEVLGKPADDAEARITLEKLRGRVHRVITGLAVRAPASPRPLRAHVVTRVRMRDYTATEVEASITQGVPFDKAGGYGIQDPALRPVEGWEGCYCNVMGLPVWTARGLLKRAGIKGGLERLPERCAECPCREA